MSPSDPTVPRWTPETERDFADRLRTTYLFTWAEMSTLALTWLADRGLLLPPGGETRTEAQVAYYPTEKTKAGPNEMTYRGWTPEKRAREFDAARSLGMEISSERTRSVTSWPDGATLTGPWLEATDGD